MKQRTLAGLSLIMGLCVFAAAWSAQEGEARVVKYRQAVMTVQAETFASLTAMVTGKTPYNPKRAQVLSDRTVMLARITGETFPDSSRDAPGSRARPEIWSDRQDFKRMMSEYIGNTTGVATAARNGSADSLRPAIVAVGRTCRSCHQRYESLP